MGKKENAFTQVPAEARPVDLKTLPLSPWWQIGRSKVQESTATRLFLPGTSQLQVLKL